ncbi:MULTISPECIES: GNAT family N-acetyltransferase [unclassified Paenibacillus]|uniref:GNAT family N-acetyltransferase n=1 Tax=unclassified Paenibacillus TaxID=185978 RepID=UPI002406EE42|nr:MULTISPECIES: GNAT family N-acetyltransferase [unclassified Paenibacillus]MDF9845300.1 putative GNAT family acetyltransferase [Paenibacillus sp. PastF-2]MDF9851882.1 putative GNAT family acetyltransferase [Paenibacillus sp. PastM-2]MDF9857747.1 putative GNAT family acetyltransferase [Paenibacillus sp. PastF-1]MDH6483014.1 putative GNAT family acetyltransferase [Paenibacillus sp. PastH-2]MDH6509183.1 putative GNAT family acetyltransferase [Paenibacillus sp. PastM-3]
MQFKLYTDVHEFYKDTYDVLMRHEAQNLIPLGNIIMGHAGEDKTDWRDPVNWLMATISDDKGIQLTAIMTPPHNITLYATDNNINPEAVSCLIDGLKDRDIPGVTTEKTLAEYFAKEYTLSNGITFKTVMNQRIYELTAVNPGIQKPGIVRLLDNKDIHFFPYWAEAFNAAAIYGKTEMSIPQEAAPYLYRIESKKLYILEDNGIPVSMAGYTRVMQTAIGVAFVYTPPYERSKGYATSIVAQISQLALEKGFTKCVLYTDLANPTSNSIYQKIGYTPVCDSLQLQFE